MASVSSSVSTTSYDAYDALGRVRQSSQMTEGNTYSFSYTYNRADRMTSQTYPSGLTVATEYDEAGRVAGVRRGSSAYYYAGAAPTDPKRIGYSAHGAVTSRLLGNGLKESADFNSRLQPTQIRLWDETAMQNVVNLGYDFGTTTDNGNILGQTIAIETPPGLNPSQTYTYDSLNRLETASETNSWSQTYGYDRYGNRWVAAGAEYGSNPALTPTLQSDFDLATNRLVGSSHDAAGNLTVDATARTFGYDAENHQIRFQSGLDSVNYFYDGEGRRVKKQSGTEITIYVYNILGQLMAEYSNGSDTETGHKYVTADHLGSTRLVTDGTAAVKNRYDYLPFGEEIAAAYGNRSTVLGYGFPDTVKHKFTGKERDSESGLDFFGARYNSGTQGRFTSPDPYEIVVRKNQGRSPKEKRSLLNSFISNPQAWNKYAYTLNNPIKLVDIDGNCSAPAGLGGGQTGICVEAFIAGRRVGLFGIGLGDNRPTSGFGGSYRLHGDFRIDRGVIDSTPPDVGISSIFFEGFGQRGTGGVGIAGLPTTDADGTLHFTVAGVGFSGFSGIGGPAGDISFEIQFTVSPSGDVTVNSVIGRIPFFRDL